MTQPAALTAPVKWAQRKDSVYVTIDLPDVTNEEVVLNEKCLTFKGESNGNSYHVELDFFAPVDTEAKESKWAVGQRNVQFFILKKDKEAEFWPRLLEDKLLEKTNVKIDWSKFVDEDDDEAEQGFDTNAMGGGAGGFDINQMMSGGAGGPPGGMDMASMMAQMQQGAGAGDMGEEEDSDDEDLPDLEEA